MLYAQEKYEFFVGISRVYANRVELTVDTLLPVDRYEEFVVTPVFDSGRKLPRTVLNPDITVSLDPLKEGEDDYLCLEFINNQTGAKYYSNKIRVTKPLRPNLVFPTRNVEISSSVAKTPKPNSPKKETYPTLLELFEHKYFRYLFMIVPTVLGLIIGYKLSKV